jgi:LysM repeat protein
MKKLLSIGAVVAVSTAIAANAEASEHTVKSGESLSSIADENNTSVASLKEANDLSSNLILPGQVLSISEGNSDGNEEDTVNDSKEELTGGTYTIEAGDTLFIIAEKFDVSVQDIKSWNNLSSDLIFAGKEITVSGDGVSEKNNEESREVEESAQSEESSEAPAPSKSQQNTQPEQEQNNQQPKAENQSTQSTNTNDGQNWGALAACESSGNPSVVSANGLYHGLYQFDVQTWRSVGGSGLPSDASAAEQTKRAQKLYAERGASPWPVCGQRL